MPISLICDKCHKELEEYGGILLSPPEEDGRVEKFHLCRHCYEKIKENLFEEIIAGFNLLTQFFDQ